MSIRARFQLAWPGFSLDLDLALPGQGVTALFGHSGSGKTSFLRCVAGLERGARGLLEVNGEVWQDDAKGFWLPPHRRPIGVVFQDAKLFAHLTVRRNLEFGWQRIDAAQRHVGFEQAVELLGIAHLLERMPDRLSGGERQRVAIARALLTSPKLLLMDEPLAALDHARKAEILPYLERLHDELSIPLFYVSHAADEVARLADHLVLLADGRAVASGALAATLARVDLPGVFADDAGAVIEARVGEHDDHYGLSRLDFAGGDLWVGRSARPVGAPVRARIPVRDVSIARERPLATSILNVLPARIDAFGDEGGNRVIVRLLLGEGSSSAVLLARITRKSCEQMLLAAGDRVFAQVKSVALME